MTHLALEMELLPRPGSPRAARRALRAALQGTDPSLVEAAELLVSELVTNAAQHSGGRSTIVLRIRLEGRWGVRLEVTDDSGDEPTPQRPSPAATSGRGLAVVEALADTWGVESIPGDGKTVWCELGAHRRTASP